MRSSIRSEGEAQRRDDAKFDREVSRLDGRLRDTSTHTLAMSHSIYSCWLIAYNLVSFYRIERSEIDLQSLA